MGGRPALQAASLVIAAAFQYVSVRRFSAAQEERFAPERRFSDFDMAITLSPSTRVNAVIGTGHFLSHYYQLCLPPMFLVWQSAFDVSFAQLGLSLALMSCATGLLQTPVGFLVDRYGARPFLIGGALLMSLSIAALGLTTAYWQVLLLCLASGIGNSVIHPTDYAILSGSVDRSQLGRSFAMHTFCGNLGSALAPPVSAMLMILLGWRSMLLFFGFFMLTAIAGGGIQSWLIPVLHQVHGVGVEAASLALTGFLGGATGGVLLGGWFADRSNRHLAFTVLLTIASAALILLVCFKSMSDVATIGVLLIAGLLIGASRTPRDVMLKDASPPGQIGKVFGFVSAGLPLGGALAPVPFGFLIDNGRADLVLALAAAILMASLLCVGTARAAAGREA